MNQQVSQSPCYIAVAPFGPFGPQAFTLLQRTMSAAKRPKQHEQSARAFMLICGPLKHALCHVVRDDECGWQHC